MITLQIRSWDAALLWTVLEALNETEEIRDNEQGYRLSELQGDLTEAIVDSDGIIPSYDGSGYFKEYERLWSRLADLLWPDKPEVKDSEKGS
jgi:hypothetical protein